MRFVALLLALLCASAHAIGPDQYDAEIRAASERWLPGSDWLRYRALLWQESRFDPDAESPVGAQGVAQFMPGTWRDVSRALGYGLLSPNQAGPAIDAGAYYLSTRVGFWTEPRSALEYRRWGEGCYNAGCGRLLRAQRRCRANCRGECLSWHEIDGYLPAETRAYVPHIERWHRLMVATR